MKRVRVVISGRVQGVWFRGWTREEAEEARDTMAEDMETFETGLHALRYGLSELGLKPAPTGAIANKLDEVLATWGETCGHLDRLLKTGAIPVDVQSLLFEKMNQKTKTLDEIVHAYVVFAKHDYD